MTRIDKPSYYCAAARALEVVGEKWSLLVVRDLLRGSKRFSDLAKSLGGITPKLLTLRLRDLESAGVVERDEEPGRRDVWYRLTPAGFALRPVIQELLIWGVEHARLPEAEDLVNSDRVAYGSVAVLNRRGLFPPQPEAWLLNIGNGPASAISFDGERWSAVDPNDVEPVVSITATPERWIELLREGSPHHAAVLSEMEIVGTPDRGNDFQRLFVPVAQLKPSS